MTGEQVKGDVTYKLTEAYPGEHLIVEFIGKEKVGEAASTRDVAKLGEESVSSHPQ